VSVLYNMSLNAHQLLLQLLQQVLRRLACDKGGSLSTPCGQDEWRGSFSQGQSSAQSPPADTPSTLWKSTPPLLLSHTTVVKALKRVRPRGLGGLIRRSRQVNIALFQLEHGEVVEGLCMMWVN
jgi:hypothetical protein